MRLEIVNQHITIHRNTKDTEQQATIAVTLMLMELGCEECYSELYSEGNEVICHFVGTVQEAKAAWKVVKPTLWEY